jgi:ADP-ribose pyrophosphatase YjhB (NUDIX family)
MNRSNIRVKAYAVFRRGDEILVNEVRQKDGKLISFRIPGGHVEFGEKAFDAVQREIMEELKTEAENYQPLPVMRSFFLIWLILRIKAFINANASRRLKTMARLLPSSG